MQQRDKASRDRSRIAGSVAIFAGAAFIAGEVLSRARPDTDSVACATGAAYLANIIDLLNTG